MVKTSNIFSLNKALVVLALGFSSFVMPLAFLKPLYAQSVAESQIRPAITTDNDRILVHSLIKSSILSLNQANQTGNYSVLRELGSPEFQANNTNEDLALIFKEIRETGLDFAAIVEYNPIFDIEPTLDDQNNLRVMGYFSTFPKIEFDLGYQLVNGRFVVDVFTVGIVPVTDTQAE